PAEGGGPMSDRAPVSIVIVTWNSLPYVDACLASLRALERAPSDTILVDSGSTDGTPARVRERFPEVRVVECGETVGYCRPSSLGTLAGGRRSVLVLSPDPRVAPTFVEVLLRAFDGPAVGLAGGRLLRFDGVTLDSAGQELGRSRQPV